MQHEKTLQAEGISLVAGVDEAGRGPLAGPVVASACMFKDGVAFPDVNDCKLLTPEKREELFDLLVSHPSVNYAIGIVSSVEIDSLNILQATIEAMLLAVGDLPVPPEFLLVDGMAIPHPTIPSQGIVKGDTLSQSIAAASVIAKVTRDRLMLDYHEEWPQYGFASHKGYGTAAHRAAIAEFGPCPIHRMSFAPLKVDPQITSSGET